MGRKILAVIVAMITAVAIIWLTEMVGTMAAPDTPKNLAYMTREELVAYIHTLPVSAYVIVIVGYVLASFAAGFVVTKMTRRESPGITLPILVGALLVVGGLLNFFVWLPGQPAWFIVTSLLIYIPLALLGHRIAR